MYGVFTYIWLIFMVNVGKYTMNKSFGMCKGTCLHFSLLISDNKLVSEGSVFKVIFQSLNIEEINRDLSLPRSVSSKNKNMHIKWIAGFLNHQQTVVLSDFFSTISDTPTRLSPANSTPVTRSASGHFLASKYHHTVDGRNLAPVDRQFIHGFPGFIHPQVVVWDFFHQQYHRQIVFLNLFEPNIVVPSKKSIIAVSWVCGR